MVDFRTNPENKTRDEWRTPSAFFKLIHLMARGSLTLDAAATADNTKLGRFLTGPCIGPSIWTKSVPGCPCGLCTSWAGERGVWANPPYGALSLRSWANKFTRREPTLQVFLMPSSTSAGWFEQMWKVSTTVLFLRPRIQFEHPPGCECASCKAGNTADRSSVDNVLFVRDWRIEREVPRPPKGGVFNWAKALEEGPNVWAFHEYTD